MFVEVSLYRHLYFKKQKQRFYIGPPWSVSESDSFCHSVSESWFQQCPNVLATGHIIQQRFHPSDDLFTAPHALATGHIIQQRGYISAISFSKSAPVSTSEAIM